MPSSSHQIPCSIVALPTLRSRRYSSMRRTTNIIHSTVVYGGSSVALVYGAFALPPLRFDLILLFVGWLLTGLGITVGYHRMLAHRAFVPTELTKWALLGLGAMAGQGPPAYWAVLHRNHHKHSDEFGDPHSPVSGYEGHAIRGFLHAHVGWIHGVGIPESGKGARDILRDPTVKKVGRLYPILMLTGFVIPTIVAAISYGSFAGGTRGLIWGAAARVVLVNHVIWSINSICHLTGSQRYKTNDFSRNSWWLSLLSLGEAWHNNHHACPGSSAFGHKWWEFDVGYWAIRALHRCRLVTEVSLASPRALARLALRTTAL